MKALLKKCMFGFTALIQPVGHKKLFSVKWLRYNHCTVPSQFQINKVINRLTTIVKPFRAEKKKKQNRYVP